MLPLLVLCASRYGEPCVRLCSLGERGDPETKYEIRTLIYPRQSSSSSSSSSAARGGMRNAKARSVTHSLTHSVSPDPTSKCGSAAFLFAISYETTFGSRDGRLVGRTDGRDVLFLFPGHSCLGLARSHLAKFPNANDPMQRRAERKIHISSVDIAGRPTLRRKKASLVGKRHVIIQLTDGTERNRPRSARWIKIEREPII